MLIRIKWRHITEARKVLRANGIGISLSCPMALAVREAFGSEDVSAGITHVTVDGVEYKYGEAAYEFVRKFDFREPSLGPTSVSISRVDRS